MSGGICSENYFALKWGKDKIYPLITKYLHVKIGGICSEIGLFLAEIRRVENHWGDLRRNGGICAEIRLNQPRFFTKITPFFTLFGGVSAEMSGF